MGKYIRANNYINIQGWMVTDLKLKGNQLLLFACIYGFTQDGENWFEGTRGYLAEWCSINIKNVTVNLKELVRQGFILKEDYEVNKVHLCRYKANLEMITAVLHENAVREETGSTKDNKDIGVQEEKRISDTQSAERQMQPVMSEEKHKTVEGRENGIGIGKEGVGTKHPHPPYQQKIINSIGLEGGGDADGEGRYETSLPRVQNIPAWVRNIPTDNKNDKEINNINNPSYPVRNPDGGPGMIGKERWEDACMEPIDHSGPSSGSADMAENRLVSLAESELPMMQKKTLLEQEVKKTIGYEALRDKYAKNDMLRNVLDDIVQCLVMEVYLCKRKCIRFSQQDNDTEFARKYFAYLTLPHVDSVLQNMQRISRKPGNMVSYLLTSLYRSLHSQAYQEAAKEYAEKNKEMKSQKGACNFNGIKQRDYDVAYLENMLLEK